MNRIPVTPLSALLAMFAAGCPGEPGFDADPIGVGLECETSNIMQTAAADASRYDAAAFSAAYDHPQGDPSALVDTMMKCYVGELQGAQCQGIQLPVTPVPGCAVAIMKDFEIAYLGGYGKADVENDVDFDIGTLSGIGSASKTITALAAMKMVEDGLLQLGDPNDANQADDAPDPWSGFTLYELLSHRSLLPRSAPWSELTFPGTSCGGDTPLPGADYEQTSDRLLCLLDQAYGLSLVDDEGGYQYDYHPGIHPRLMAYFSKDLPPQVLQQPDPLACTATAAYSNAGYGVAAAMVDRAAIYHYYDPDEVGLNEAYPYDGYEQYVWKNVLNPPQSNVPGTNARQVAPMRSACVMTKWRKPAVASLTARDYGDSALLYDDWDLIGWGWEGPAGGWFMTIGDLARLALRVVPEDDDDSVVSPATAAYMRQVHSRLESPACLRYGMGVHTLAHQLTQDGDGPFNEWFASHDGGIAQYQAGYRIHPTDGYGVALMCNAPLVGSASAKFTELLQLARDLQPTGNALPYSPIGELSIAYAAQMYAEWQGYLDRAGGDYDTALANVQSDLLAEPEGRQVLAAVSAGDYATAARLMMTILDRR